MTGSRQPGTTFSLIFKRQPKEVQCPREQSSFFPALDARTNLSWSQGGVQTGWGSAGSWEATERKGCEKPLPNELEVHGHILPGYTGAVLEEHKPVHQPVSKRQGDQRSLTISVNKPADSTSTQACVSEQESKSMFF